jgi:hypothetical protein
VCSRPSSDESVAGDLLVYFRKEARQDGQRGQ